jgi:hypothetical protein
VKRAIVLAAGLALWSPPGRAVGAPHIRSGKVRALGFSGAARLAWLPQVPTIAEAGVPGFPLRLGMARPVRAREDTFSDREPPA